MSELKLQEVTHLVKSPSAEDTEQTQHPDCWKPKPDDNYGTAVPQFMKHNTSLLINDQNWI